MPDRISDYMPDRMSDRMSQNMSDRMLDRMSQYMSDSLSEYQVRIYVQMYVMVGITRSKVFFAQGHSVIQLFVFKRLPRFCSGLLCLGNV